MDYEYMGDPEDVEFESDAYADPDDEDRAEPDTEKLEEVLEAIDRELQKAKTPAAREALMGERERVEIKREARVEGISMSGWIRNAALEKLSTSTKARRLGTVEELASFFSACDDREKGQEPDWDERMGSSRGRR